MYSILKVNYNNIQTFTDKIMSTQSINIQLEGGGGGGVVSTQSMDIQLEGEGVSTQSMDIQLEGG